MMDPSEFYPQFNDEIMRGVDQYIEAQARFIEAWQENLTKQADDEIITEGARGIADAYQIWLDASREWIEQLVAVAEGEELNPRDIRDVWLRAANDSSQALMSTAAFAQLTGQSVRDGLELQRQRDEAMQAMLETMGVATGDNVEEVGERLVELERRQHAVERKLDRLLEQLDNS